MLVNGKDYHALRPHLLYLVQKLLRVRDLIVLVNDANEGAQARHMSR